MESRPATASIRKTSKLVPLEPCPCDCVCTHSYPHASTCARERLVGPCTCARTRTSNAKKPRAKKPSGPTLPPPTRPDHYPCREFVQPTDSEDKQEVVEVSSCFYVYLHARLRCLRVCSSICVCACSHSCPCFCSHPCSRQCSCEC